MAMMIGMSTSMIGLWWLRLDFLGWWFSLGVILGFILEWTWSGLCSSTRAPSPRTTGGTSSRISSMLLAAISLGAFGAGYSRLAGPVATSTSKSCSNLTSTCPNHGNDWHRAETLQTVGLNHVGIWPQLQQLIRPGSFSKVVQGHTAVQRTSLKNGHFCQSLEQSPHLAAWLVIHWKSTVGNLLEWRQVMLTSTCTSMWLALIIFRFQSKTSESRLRSWTWQIQNVHESPRR